MDRRAFLGTLAGGLLAAPLARDAEQARVARIGYLSLISAVRNAANLEAFRQGRGSRRSSYALSTFSK
jgi:hypothetical protein